MSPVYRNTQRAPLSCTACAARKVRCSKEIPCRTCVARGSAADCRRELVVVRGRIRTADIPASSLSNAELQLENSRLAAMITNVDATDEPDASAIDLTEHYERRLYIAVGQSGEKRTVSSLGDIIMPSKACSLYLIHFSETWTSWIHYGLFFPHFRDEHTQFWYNDGDLSLQDPLWLAIYFGVLSSTLIFTNKDEFLESRPPLDSHDALLKNWYDTALYFLDTADFMQKLDIRIVRAIVILGIVATNAGDTIRHTNLWAYGIRVAQQLGLGSDRANNGESAIQRESRRRLWWTLIICEWIPIPGRAPCVSNIDFDCDLPADIDDGQLLQSMDRRKLSVTKEPRAVQYHICMSKIAIICYQFHSKMRLRRWSASEIAEFVLQADNQLANLIDQLPPHLQNDELETVETRDRDTYRPWIPYQKTSLAMVILYYRLAVNRILQSHWLKGSANYARARSVCLSCAMGIVNSAVTYRNISSRMRSWAFAMEIYSSAVTLALEVQGSEEQNEHYTLAILECKKFLMGVKDQNKLASVALDMLNDLIQS